MHPRPPVGWVSAVDTRGHEAIHPTSDESDSELDQVPVPVVEPRFGGGAVEHPVGFVVVAVHLQLQLKIGGQVGTGIAPAGVERGEHPRHFQENRFEMWRVIEPTGHRASRPMKKS